MNNGAFGENFPYSNFHDINMDWIIQIAKDFLDQYTHIQEIISNGEQSLQDLTTDGLEQLQEKADTLEELLQQWYNTHSEDIANQLSSALQEMQTTLTQMINTINTRTDIKLSEALSHIPADYSDLVNMLRDTTGNYEAVFTSGSRSMTEPQVVEPSDNWKNAILECHPGQQFQISGSGGSGAQLYMFFDVDYHVLTTSGDSTRWDTLHTVTAPENAKYLIVNSRVTEEPTYVGKCIVNSYVREDIEKIVTVLNMSKIITRNVLTKGYINYSNINTIVSDPSWECAKIDVVPGQICKVKGSGGSANQLWFVATESGTILIYAGDSIRTTDYMTFTIPPTGKYLIVNHRITEESLYPFSALITYPTTPDKHLCRYTYNNIDVSTFTTDSGASDWYWLTEIQYPAGYIDHISIYGTDDSIGRDGYIAIYDISKQQCIYSSEAVRATTRKVTFDIGIYCENPVYICARLPHLCHRNYDSALNYANMWQFAPPVGEGVEIPISWYETKQPFRFAIEVWYNTQITEPTNTFAKENNNMFIAGDSITAGYPYLDETNQLDNSSIRWGEQLKRKYGFEVTYGAETGGGWIYLPNPSSRNAITIANNTDFSEYDTAVFAFGTNDYGGNIPLGNITDMYPNQQTVCGGLNYIINKVYTDNPHIVLIISTPINRGDKGTEANNFGYGTRNTAGYTLLELVNKMIEVCNNNGVCVIDNSNSPFNKHSFYGLTYDSLHPNIKGYHVLGAMMAERVAQFTTPYLRDFTR